MSKTAQVNFEVNNNIQFITEPADGISFVSGVTVKGPFAKPDTIINNWSQFVKLFGGIHPTDNFPLHCKRILEAGGRLRVNRVGHYTDPTSAATLDAVLAEMNPITNLVLDGALIAANEVSVDISANGAASETISATFATDSNTTLAALATALEAKPYVASSYVVNSGAGTNNHRTVVIIPEEGFELLIDQDIVIGGASQALTTLNPVKGFMDSNGNLLFTFAPKYKGADYNNYSVVIGPASNGNANYFNLSFIHAQEPELNESYENMSIPGSPNVASSDYLRRVTQESPTFSVTYYDLSAISSPIRPANNTFDYIGGSDGSAVVAADYIGDSNAKNGFYAFDGYDDSYQIFVPTADETIAGLHTAGFTYAQTRDDIHYWAHLNQNLSKTALIAAKAALNINNKFGAFFSGGQLVIDPRNGEEIAISELSNIAALAAVSDGAYGPWYSFAGLNRGKLLNTLGVAGNNYGSPAATSDMQEFVDARINMVVNRDGGTYLWNLYAASLDNDPEKFLNVGRLLLFIKKSLRAPLESFLEDPNDVATWRQIYYTVKPFIETLLTNRAVSRAEWQGDQNVSAATDDQMQVNTQADVLDGKYKVNFKITPIAPLKEITVAINIIDGVGVTFDLEQ